jgi:hypothetical protein
VDRTAEVDCTNLKHWKVVEKKHSRKIYRISGRFLRSLLQSLLGSHGGPCKPGLSSSTGPNTTNDPRFTRFGSPSPQKNPSLPSSLKPSLSLPPEPPAAGHRHRHRHTRALSHQSVLPLLVLDMVGDLQLQMYDLFRPFLFLFIFWGCI